MTWNWLARLISSAAGVLIATGTMMAGPPAGQTTPPANPEWMIKLHEIATGDPMKSGASPLALSKSLFGWDSMAQQHGIPLDGTISRSQYKGTPERFDQLDRDRDGVLKATDFDWSDQAPFVQQQALAASLFNRLNSDGDGSISPEEWKKWFDRTGGDAGKLTQDDIRRMMFATPPRSTNSPTRMMRLLGFLTGELGSMNEGPNPGKIAPDFTLKTQDESRTVKLSDFRGIKPVVLIFGNFT